MASGKSSKAVRNARAATAVKKPKPWGTLAAVAVLVLFAGGIFTYVYTQYEATADIRAFTPSEENQNPALDIEGVTSEEYAGQLHVVAPQRVAYEEFPPNGGPHDEVWAGCNGVVYDVPVRNENMVHSLEHGAVWIAYNEDQIQGEDLETLRNKVLGEPAMMMSPYPDLDSPISLQAWGHRLKVDSADDERIDQFITALQLNAYVYPEIGATCMPNPARFDVDNPPPFDPSEPGPDAMPMSANPEDFGGYTGPSDEMLDPSGAPEASEEAEGDEEPAADESEAPGSEEGSDTSDEGDTND
ncbi:DUF3105 domain-containing protein [Actinoalloteichus spitiensis]|uniref:DUF3105 domain-containing protein n=1 Tax=Actinoalloteichus spitiensis TaxID=252394 RepID=UPI000360D7D8|nr:DUF3105 domain-containing protein [Actinoalloteichus spitiensis]